MNIPPTGNQHDHRFDVPWLLVLIGLALSIAGGGASYLRHRQEQVRQAAHDQLQVIADLKSQQLSDWLQERMTDAEWIAATPYAARRALDTLAQPGSATTRNIFTAWLKPLRVHRYYERFFLLDENHNVALEYPPRSSSNRAALASHVLEAAQQATRTRHPCMTDLHQAEGNSTPHLDFAVPLSVPPHPAQETSETRSKEGPPVQHSAVLILQVNASAFLNPLLHTWPTPFKTAETLLVRREGEEIMYLSDLRGLTNAALRLRLPLSHDQLPAAMALRGEGVHEGVDYHGVPVVAAVRKVPTTPWLLETKVDKAEIYQPLRREACVVIALAAALLLAIVMAVWMLQRHRQQILLALQLQAERRQRVLAERFEHLMRSAADAILLADEHDRILEANERAQSLYGYTLSELQALTLHRLSAPEQGSMTALSPEFGGAALCSSEGSTLESVHRRSDGTVFPVEVSSRQLLLGDTRCRLAIIRDISKRKEAEEELRQRNEELSRFNQASVGRELRMVELKREINDLCHLAGLEPRYALTFVSGTDSPAPAAKPSTVLAQTPIPGDPPHERFF